MAGLAPIRSEPAGSFVAGSVTAWSGVFIIAKSWEAILCSYLWLLRVCRLAVLLAAMARFNGLASAHQSATRRGPRADFRCGTLIARFCRSHGQANPYILGFSREINAQYSPDLSHDLEALPHLTSGTRLTRSRWKGLSVMFALPFAVHDAAKVFGGPLVRRSSGLRIVAGQHLGSVSLPLGHHADVEPGVQKFRRRELRRARIEPSKSSDHGPMPCPCSRRSAAATARFAHRSLRPNAVTDVSIGHPTGRQWPRFSRLAELGESTAAAAEPRLRERRRPDVCPQSRDTPSTPQPSS